MIFDLRGNRVSLNSPVVFTVGGGSLELGRVVHFSSGQLQPGHIRVEVPCMQWNRDLRIHQPGVKEIKLKLNRHWKYDNDGTPLCDRVMLLEQR